MIKTHLLYLTLFFILFHYSANAQNKWLSEEKVIYQENHDPMEVYLTDKRVFEYNGNYFSTVDSWEAGKELLLVYDTKKGLILVDPKTNDSVELMSGPEKQFDKICEACIEKNGSTRGMAYCYVDALKLWDAELNRIYKKLMATLSKSEQQTLRASQLKWISFRDSQEKFIAEIYSRASCGSMCSLEGAMARYELTKTQAKRLSSYYEPNLD